MDNINNLLEKELDSPSIDTIQITTLDNSLDTNEPLLPDVSSKSSDTIDVMETPIVETNENTPPESITPTLNPLPNETPPKIIDSSSPLPQDTFFKTESFYDKNPLPAFVKVAQPNTQPLHQSPLNPLPDNNIQQNNYTENITPQPSQPLPTQNVPTIKKKSPSRTVSGSIIGGFITVILVASVFSGMFFIKHYQENPNNLFDFSWDNSVNQDESEADPESPNSTLILPTNPKPEVAEKYKDSDGRYTTQGIAKVVSPSVVGIVGYSDQTIVPTSQATGIIISSDGYILSNAHVFEGVTAQKIITSDGKEYEAVLVGADPKSDLAVIKVTSDDSFVAAEFGDSSMLELGEQVMVIGNPGHFSGSITGGYVSGLDRLVKVDQNGVAMKCIQTDAAVNPGNSGGPLVNMFGQVVGVVSSKYIAPKFDGIGFAISINEALPIVADIVSMGYIGGRTHIGIIFQTFDANIARELNVVPGLYVVEIDPDCDIANSGIQLYDIITDINGVKVHDATDVKRILLNSIPGDIVTAKVYRKPIVGEPEILEISFALMEDTSPAVMPSVS